MKKATYYFAYKDKIYYIKLTVDEFKELKLPAHPEFITDEQFEKLKKYFSKKVQTLKKLKYETKSKKQK